jgi:sulfite exporter TauE/SafE
VIAIVPAGGANAALASCAGSAVASATHWQALLALHAGRLGTYALIGALAGATGGLGLMWHPLRQLHWPLLLLGNLALLYLGLRVAGVNLPWSLPRFLAQAIQAVPAALQKITRRLPRHPFFKGMAWGCMPCGLLATVLPFALLSGSAWSGAVLLILFGMGTLPYLLALQLPPQFRHHPRLAGRPLRMGAALLLCAWAVFGLLQLAGWVAGPMAAWCVAG